MNECVRSDEWVWHTLAGSRDVMGEPVERGVARTSLEFSSSFVDLYFECFTPMVRLAWALSGSEAAAEDLVQDAFVRVHAHWERVEKPRPYLRQAVVNACRSASRRTTRERTAGRFPLAEVAQLEADELFDVLARLPYRQRAAIVLQFYEGLPQSEIAKLLHCREGTVASLVHRGLAQLRRVIES
jgi:RNA polymerase sigma factor (sigma-70 family)